MRKKYEHIAPAASPSMVGVCASRVRRAKYARGARFGRRGAAKLGRGAGEVLLVLCPKKARARGQRRRKQVAS